MSLVLIEDELLAEATPAELELYERHLEAVRDDWREWARPEQIAPPDDWSVMYLRGGRGSGKTWAGSNNFAEMITSSPAGEWGVIAPTYGDARDTCIESDESGLIKALGGKAGPNGVLLRKGPHIVSWNRSMGDLRLGNGSVIYADGADDGALRIQGKNLRGAWCDEIGLWRQWETAWDESLRYAVRLAPAKIIATGTPKRLMPARALVKRLISDPEVVARLLRTVDNAANLHPKTLEKLLKLQGTKLGRQELEGELLEDIEGALWSLSLIEQDRADAFPDLARLAVAVDPAVTSNADSDETGIVVAGSTQDQQGYVLADESMRGSPERVARTVVDLFHDMQADAVVVEKNNGGDWIPALIRTVDPKVNVELVWATRGKMLRAQPVSALYEQHRIHHVGAFPELEDQLCSWTPDAQGSPDRMDALVWAVTWLLLSGPSGRRSVVSSEWAA